MSGFATVQACTDDERHAETGKMGQCLALLGWVGLETGQDDRVTMHAHTLGHGQKRLVLCVSNLWAM